MKKAIVLVALLVFMISFAIGGSSTTMPSDRKVIFEQPLGDQGCRIVVTRGADRDRSIFSFLTKNDTAERDKRRNFEMPGNYYDVRAELVPSNGQPLVISSFLRCEYPDVDIDRGVVVLDSLVERRSIVFAIAEGARITIWQIEFPGNSFVSTGLGRWQLGAAQYRVDESKAKVKLGRTESGLLTALVTEIGTGQHTQFEQQDEWELRFKVTHQWRGDK